MPLDHPPGTFFGPGTLVDLVRQRAEQNPNDIAFTYLVDGESERLDITNQQLDRRARAIAAWLQSQGMVGERALLLYPAGLEFVSAFLGCIYAGVTAVPVYPPRRNRSLERIQAIADDGEAKLALTAEAVLRRVKPLIEDTPHLKRLTWLATCRCPVGMEQSWQKPDIDGDTLAFLQYTSGSTGIPKGVMLTHANLIHNSSLIAHAFEHTRSALGVFWLPSYHDMGLIGGILQPLFCGRPNVLMSPMAFMQKPFRWLGAISRFGATTSGGPNFAYDLCVRRVTPEQRKQLDLSTWQVAFNGAEPVRQETMDRFCEVFEPCGFRREAFYPCFGLAEATLIVSGGYVRRNPVARSFDGAALSSHRVVPADPDDRNARCLVGCGETLPDQELVIADCETGVQKPESKIGEIWVGGPSVALGYWRRPAATKETFRARLADSGAGPFLRTGDLGFIKEGELFVTGRIKDLIILRGMNIYPQDIERTVQSCHPRLRPDSGAAFTVQVEGPERLVIVQELHRRKKAALAEVFEAIQRAVAAEHELTPDAIVLVRAGSIPKTSSGKIQRHACRQGYLDGGLAVIDKWEAESATACTPRERQAERSGSWPCAHRQDPSRDLGWPDSGSAAARPRHGRLRFDSVVVPPADRDRPHLNHSRTIAEQVLEEVSRVASSRARGLTLDTNIIEIGLDSLERMQIVAALERRFGGRLPEEALYQLETCRHVVEAVQRYLGDERRENADAPARSQPSVETYRIDRFPEYVQLRQNLKLAESAGLGNPFFVVHQGKCGDRTIVGGRSVIDFSTCNYLGMAGDPLVIKASQEAAAEYGTSVSASRLVSGQRTIHHELEEAMARLLGSDKAIVLDSAHVATETVLGHLLGPTDLILCDGNSHRALLPGCLLSGAQHQSFDHNDGRAVDAILRDRRQRFRRVMIVIEGVSSLDGDVPELADFVEVKNRHRALLMIDEAHCMGTLGEHGRGLAEHPGVNTEEIDIRVGTLGNALGSCGGFVAGSSALVEYLKYTAPGFVRSMGLAPPSAAAALAAVQLLENQPLRVARLQKRSRWFRAKANGCGLNTGPGKDSPVVPIVLGNSMVCLQLAKALFARGVHVQPLLYPAVSEQAARLRFFLTTLHTKEQIQYTINTMAEELDRVGSEYGFQPASELKASLQSAHSA